MKYTKPEVKALGHAKSVIEHVIPKQVTGKFDGGPAPLSYSQPAYDLDE